MFSVGCVMQAHPHPDPLSQGEGTALDRFSCSALPWQMLRAGVILLRNTIPPLLGGEGRGEGEQLQKRHLCYRAYWMLSLHFLLLLLVALTVPRAQAAEPTKAELEFFENKIRPLLANRCYKCHSHEADKLRGGLSVEFRDALLKGGETGPAIVPGDPEKSLLIKAVRYVDPDLQMPPKGQKLSESEIADLVTWVKMGAPDPRKADNATYAKWNKNPREHWAFKPIRKPAVPDVKMKEWVANPIDAFVISKLEASDMRPSPPADKRTLIRRATFDLTGLPPTEKEIEEFLADNSRDAFAKVVDRLLASPQYGERWGRYWLDVARYADTKGDVKVKFEPAVNPHAWTYRDYVIRSFNEDKPFNRFIVEQIAADKVGVGTNKWNLAALGFLTLGDRFNENKNDVVNDMIDVVTKGTMGLTVTCARCHDHKFDPISQKDYYALHGIFASSVEPEFGPYLTSSPATPEYLDYVKKFTALYKELTALEGMKRGRKSKEVREHEGDLRKEIARLEMTHPAALPRAPTIQDVSYPRDSHVFIRGEAENKGDLVPRRFIEILSGTNTTFRSGSGRYELALSITHTNNPLTPRALVNRFWLHHFGEGFVTTPDDLGNQSTPPSHPELLDWLATQFMDSGWSLKKLHRLIMLSNTYQQSSANNPRYAQIDPQNRLLWRANIRRLELEAVRDSILFIGGKLDLTMGGRPVNLGQPPYSTRRTVYGYVDRRNLPEIFTQFDFANPDISTGKRYETIVPQQALFMMNSPLVVEQARNLVTRPDFKQLSQPEERVKLLYTLIYQRPATETEIRLGVNFVDESPRADRIQVTDRQYQKERERKNRKRGGPAMSLATIAPSELKPLDAWARYAHALLQANETVFVN